MIAPCKLEKEYDDFFQLCSQLAGLPFSWDRDQHVVAWLLLI